ncbi:Gfo/Idh/MocA family protein [Virgisporangium aurantiacum]|uniref:Dehydrogenase n=1 Tax=Virgisporangium aurantiacum TaxID=175570 RepID=A0A8J3ZG41_9ACTN|nr:Gfo/Idh/MocA family oxidoreductase [Virgisporangium aurantiacum]GIJ62163.1 dehydrogenase [Virgisporangium aurantiacum]
MRRIRAAVVGTGFMGSVHARSITAAGGELVAAVGSTPEKAQRAADLLGAARGVGTVSQALAEGVDVLHVCTPNVTHSEISRPALEAGVAVVCEKPLATDVATAEALSVLAQRSGVVATVPFVYRYYASVREARNRLRGPGHPSPWLLHGSYLQDWMADAATTNWRVDPTAGGASRAFGDIGVHWCDLAEFVTGQRLTRVCARFGRSAATRPGPYGKSVPVTTEDGAVVSFETDTGAIGSVVVSQATAGRKNALSFSFDGPDASYGFCQETPESLWVGGRDFNQIVLRDPARAKAPAGRSAVLPSGHPQGYYECFADFVADTYAAIRGEHVEGLPTFADGLRAARITEAVVTSAASGSWVDIATVSVPNETRSAL